MQPDEKLELDKVFGQGTIVSDATGEKINVSYEFHLYQRMLWCGEGQPREKGSREITGRIWINAERFWARNNIGKRFTLTLSETRQLHFFITDRDGSIGNIGNSVWIPLS